MMTLKTNSKYRIVAAVTALFLSVLVLGGCTLSDKSIRSISPCSGGGSGDSVPTSLTDPIATVEKVVDPMLDVPGQLADAIEPPTNIRDWKPIQQLMPHAEFSRNEVTVRNIRNCTYRSLNDVTLDYYDKKYDLDRIRSVDVIMVPFSATPDLAHLAMSFGFEGDEYIGVSVEARRESDETYNPILGTLRQYELIYVVADERDMIRLCTDQYLSDVYIYRLKATPEQARAAFVDAMHRTNRLVDRPEFYHTLTNNCTTNLTGHLNAMYPENQKIPYSRHMAVSGTFDQLLFQRQLIDSDLSYPRTKMAARVNERAYRYADSPEFSAMIRRPLR